MINVYAARKPKWDGLQYTENGKMKQFKTSDSEKNLTENV